LGQTQRIDSAGARQRGTEWPTYSVFIPAPVAPHRPGAQPIRRLPTIGDPGGTRQRQQDWHRRCCDRRGQQNSDTASAIGRDGPAPLGENTASATPYAEGRKPSCVTLHGVKTTSIGRYSPVAPTNTTTPVLGAASRRSTRQAYSAFSHLLTITRLQATSRALIMDRKTMGSRNSNLLRRSAFSDINPAAAPRTIALQPLSPARHDRTWEWVMFFPVSCAQGMIQIYQM